MMEILAGVSATPQAPISPTAGTALPGLADMPALSAPTPPNGTTPPPPKPVQPSPPPPKPAPPSPPAAKAEPPANPVEVKPAVPITEPQADTADEKTTPGQDTPGSGDTADNFPALRAYLKQMQKDGKLPAKPTPQTTTTPKSGGLLSLFRKKSGSK